jgi:ketosteroid isomerase-like protein
MKRIGVWSLVLLVATLAAGADRAPAAGNTRSGTEQELLALETAWDDAVAAKDREKLEEIVADDFITISADGSVASKNQMIASTLAPELTIEPFKTEDVRVRLYGNTAVLSGWFSLHGTYEGKSFENSSRYTDVYVKSGGKWRAVLAQATRLSKRPGS